MEKFLFHFYGVLLCFHELRYFHLWGTHHHYQYPRKQLLTNILLIYVICIFLRGLKRTGDI